MSCQLMPFKCENKHVNIIRYSWITESTEKVLRFKDEILVIFKRQYFLGHVVVKEAEFL